MASRCSPFYAILRAADSLSRSRNLKLTLRKIDRSNWRAAIALQLREGQQDFVASPVRSLAAAYVRQYGDQFEYEPMAIYDSNLMVGYVSMLCDPKTTDEYWIDDIMIDAAYQGRGLGRAAIAETIRFIVRKYPRCEAIKLSCHRDNHRAERLYKSMGFEFTGEMNVNSGQPDYKLCGEALRAYR